MIEKEELKARLNETGQYIVSTLRDSIFKEDNVLYLAVIKILSTTGQKGAKQRFDEKKYCSFTTR
jgi:DUF438 domain-containing protein